MSKLYAVAALLIFALTISVFAQGSKEQAAPPQPEKLAADKSAQGFSFTIRLKDGKSQFKPGEIIRLELSFASSQPHTYGLDNATYDRSGRLEIDDFHLTPEDAAVDPLYDYYHNGLFGFMGGGLRGMPELESKPYLITAELNEWFRFDQPGKYRLYVTTGRISKLPPDGRIFGGENVPATSNAVEFEILPADPAWSKQKLQEATAALDASKNVNERRAACRVLRFLNTVAAAKEMVRRFRGTDSECEFEYYIGLIGTPHRAQAMAEMEKMLAAPDYPVTGSFIHVLSYLRYISENAEPLPPYPNGDESLEKLWQADMQKRRGAHEQVVKSYLEQLSLAAPSKQKEAKAVSLGTLLDYEGAYSNGKSANARDPQLASALTSVFLELPADRQHAILAYRWKQVASPDLLPVLRRIYEKPSQTNADLYEIVLKRIYDLAPEEGRQLIIKEIESGHPRVKPRALEILPDETLPELDEAIATEMQYNIDAYSVLLARYATSSIFPRIKSAYANLIGRWACAIQTPLLAYFLRVDPDYGALMLERALNSRDKEKDSRCYASQLTELRGDYWTPEVEKVALAHLDDPHPEVMISAASVLAQHGSAADEQPIWNALERWHERYAGRDEAMRVEAKKAGAIIDPAMIEIELVRALATANGWFMGADQLKRLQQLCAGKQCKDEATSLIKQSDDKSINLFFSFSDDEIVSISVAQYHPASIPALKEKLAQFPEGTTFKWNSPNRDEKTAEQLFADLQAYLKEHAMKLEKANSDK